MAETAKILYKKGSKGDEVTNIQKALGDYYTSLGGEPDAKYGNITHDAVFNWQVQWNKDNPNDHIEEDGIVGKDTYPRLMQWHANKQLPTFTESELLGEKPAAAPAPAQGGDIASVVDPTTGQKVMMPASMLPPEQQPQNGGTPNAKTPEAETPVAEQAKGDELVPVVDPTTGQKTMVPASMLPPDQQPQTAATPDANTPEAKTANTDQPQQTTQNSGQAQVVTTPSKHLYDYANNSLGSIMNTKDNNIPVRELLDDYFKWCQENGRTIDYVTVNDIVNKTHDLSKSPIDNEKLRKKAENKEKWDKVGNFLLHLGNAIGNVGGGGYASMKLEDPIHFTERQRMLKEKADQQRIVNNQSIFQQMQKGWAEQRAQEIAKQNAAHQATMEKIAAKNAETAEKRQQALENYQINQGKINQQRADAYTDLSKKTGEARVTTANRPRVGRSNPYKTTSSETVVTDANGKVLKQSKRQTSVGPYTGNRSKSTTGQKKKAIY